MNRAAEGLFWGSDWTMSGHVIQQHAKVPGAHTVMLRNRFVKRSRG